MSIGIDLSKLTEEELVDLNREIVGRLKMLRGLRRFEQIAAFRPGDRVAFMSDIRDGVVSGIVVRCNQKSVTLRTDSGEQWRVSPGLLMKTVDAQPSSSVQMQLAPGPLFDRK